MKHISETNQKFINAVFNFDIDTFKTLLDTESFDKSMLHDIKFANGMPCPIFWITQCWEIAFEHPEEWTEEVRHIIAENKKRNLEIKAIFQERFNVTFQPIDFYNTDFWFYRDERDATFEDVIWDSNRDDMIANGYRAIDLDLFVAVNKFDFKETRRLLELGANPAQKVDSDGSFCLDRIGGECSFLETELDYIMIRHKHSNPVEDNARDLINLIGYAAHESMYQLLSKYDPRK